MRSVGFRAYAVRRGAPYDLICANIVSGPLVEVAPRLSRALGPDGLVILSGILRDQESSVIAAYRAQGLALKRRVRDGDWSTLGLAAKRKRY
jgi:ribosomal protein L11 methyltransferase